MFQRIARHLCPARISADDENRVIARDGANHLGEFGPIDRQAEQLRLPGSGLDDHQLLRHVEGYQSARDRLRTAAAVEPPSGTPAA